MQHGYIKLYRDLMNWGWYKDANTVRVFLHCLLKANYTEKVFQGRVIPVGSFATSYENMAKELNLSVNKVRTAINHLKITHEITYEGTNQNSIITIKNYIQYQKDNMQCHKQITNESQSNHNQITTTKERNKGKKEECNIDIEKFFQKLREADAKEGVE